MRNSAFKVATLDTTAVQIVPPSKHRRMLVFSPNLTTGYTVATSAAVSANAGLVVTAGGGCVVLRYEDLGTLVQQAWWGIAASSTQMSVVEAFELE